MSNFGFRHFAIRAPEAPAVVDSHGRAWSRAELFATMNRISRALRASGLAEGEAVAIIAPNCFEFVATYMAATQAGLYVVPINWHLAMPEIEHVLASSRARFVFAHERIAPFVRALTASGGATGGRRFVSFGAIEGYVPLQSFTEGHSPAPIENPMQGRLLLYTSATTGRPKAILLPIEGADVTLEKTIRFHLSLGLRLEHEVHLCASTLYHAGPLDFAATALHMGHKVVLLDRWEPELLLRSIEAHRVTTSLMVPMMFVRLLKLPEAVRAKYDVSSLKVVGHTAAPCPIDTKRQMLQWWGPILRDGYGAAEGVGTTVSSEEWLEYPGTVGRPIPGSKIRILDDDGNELAPGEVGTIYLTRFQGDRFEYRDDPEKTRAAYRGEFFTVGDVGYLNEAGYLFICDRRIEMILCGGTNIYPAEIEQVLVQHPKVADCAVFGIPDELSGESVKAAVQPMPGVTPGPALTLELMSFLRKHLAVFKVPRHFEYVAALPRDPNGKLYKRRLREPHWRGGALPA